MIDTNSMTIAFLLLNAGVPMIFWQLPLAVWAFVPVVVAEALVASPILCQPIRPVGWRILLANALSTFIGIPVAWAGMLLLNIVSTGTTGRGFDTPWAAFQSIVLQASWLLPYPEQLVWLIPAATLVLLVPYFLISVFIERWVLLRSFRKVETARVSRAVWRSNAVTYGMFGVWAGYRLFLGLLGGSELL